MEYEDRVGAYAHEIFGGLASEGGLDHLAPTLDFALYLWSYPDWKGKPEKLADRHIPLWQLVYHGIILSNPYYTTIDALYPKMYETSYQRKGLQTSARKIARNSPSKRRRNAAFFLRRKYKT